MDIVIIANPAFVISSENKHHFYQTIELLKISRETVEFVLATLD